MGSVRLRSDFDAGQVRRLAKAACDVDQVRRLLSIAAVYEGMSREDAARLGGMDRQTLRDCVHRFNAKGADGLVDRPPPGNPRRLTPAQEADLAGLVEGGPGLAVRAGGAGRAGRAGLGGPGSSGPVALRGPEGSDPGALGCGLPRAHHRQAAGSAGGLPHHPASAALPPGWRSHGGV